MAHDISIGEAPPPVQVATVTFDELYMSHADEIGQALLLIAGDGELAQQSHSDAFARAAQRWRVVEKEPYPQAWVLRVGSDLIAAEIRDRPADFINTATGGYIRGLDLADSVRALPARQRAALVASYFLEWSDEQAAAGLGLSVEGMLARRSQALAFLQHHLGSSRGEVVDLVTAHLHELDESQSIESAPVDAVRRAGQFRRIGRRAAVGAVVLLVIAAAAALLSWDGPSGVAEPPPEPVEPPTASSEWFGPIGDGTGDFIALDAAGGARFARSADGVDWFREAVWNSRGVDIRTEVTAFDRSGDQYLATIEASAAIRQVVTPNVAISDDLASWRVFPLEIGELSDVDGVRNEVDVLGAAAAGAVVLASVSVEEAVDYPSLGMLETDACVEIDDPDGLTVHLCDGTVVPVASAADRNVESAPEPSRLFLNESEQGFVEVEPPPGFDPYGLFLVGNDFAMIDVTTSDIISSSDGRNWRTLYRPPFSNRFGLAAGSAQGELMVVTPELDGWTSQVSRGDSLAQGSLPLELDPSAVWIKPELVWGPAGWALFVTTSRPWDRPEATRSWAVEADGWVISQRPDSDVIVARSLDELSTIRYTRPGPNVLRDDDGKITLLDPRTSNVLFEITQEQIDNTRAAAIDSEQGTKAQLFFSEDGVEWRVLWSTTEETWFGTPAVGDDRVLLSRTQLTGGPIVIPLNEDG